MTPWRERLIQSRWLFAVEMSAVAAVFVADWNHLIFFSKTPYLLALGWGSMAVRGVRWRDLGFRIPRRWGWLVMAGLAAGASMEALELFITQPALVALTGQKPDLSNAAVLVADWKLFALSILFSWTFAAFGEELVWRGYVLNRLANACRRSKPAWIAALVLMSAAFGLAHSDQGVTGIIENFVNGLLLGGLYLATGRNLLVPVLAHGITDTIDFALLFTGHYPLV